MPLEEYVAYVAQHLNRIAGLIIKLDGDRDPTAGSNLSVEASLGLAQELRHYANEFAKVEIDPNNPHPFGPDANYQVAAEG